MGFYKEGKNGRSTGLEPATFGTTIQRSNQLSYDRHKDPLFLDKNAFSSIKNRTLQKCLWTIQDIILF